MENEKHEIKVIQTEDGSSSLYLPEMNETYHSFHGAKNESEHVFIDKGLLHCVEHKPRKEVNILEVGFGTGLNVLLSLRKARTLGVKISYTTLEPFPLPANIVAQLNYGKLMEDEKLAADFEVLHNSPWDEEINVDENFLLTKKQCRLQELQETEAKFDLVYFDAFAPNKQAEMWELGVLQKVVKLMKSGGVFVTYCAKGQFKRDLKAVGLTVETLQGPPGKKEMVRGLKDV